MSAATTPGPERELPGWRAAVDGAARLLAEAGVPSPHVDALALAEHALGLDRLVLAMAPAPTAETLASFAALVERRRRREPLQHITGRMAFRHLTLRSAPGAFITRPETEVVAGHAIDAARAVTAGGAVVVDLCTGSGAIALAVATEVPGAQVWAVELSADALAVARRNVAETAPHVHLVGGDAADALPELDGGVDVVVANPPYIPPDAVPREVEVREHDPDLALYGGGADGLDTPRAVVRRAADLLRPGGVLVMEHAEVQAADVRALVAGTGAFAGVRTAPDLTGRDRMVLARRAGPAAR
ncbi:peptide chain release factor N(5)-glutamine methyltransferase [Georgenia wangjunii]|uniref:peptide chain release factor N(5)-glutamine methyltransferase n=1 Tax=Georgenia wangjunii TaxID=3117730 RepID=UPI002F26C1AC